MDFSELSQLAEDIVCPPYEFRVGCVTCNSLTCRKDDGDVHYWFVEATLVRKDIYNDALTRGYGGKNIFPNIYPKDNAIKRFFVTARDYSEHEVREAFLYKGKRVLSPHMPIETLWEVIGDGV